MSQRILRVSPRRGLTMLELLLASTIMAILVAALATMATAVNQANEYNQGYGDATQHGRVACERIARHMREATTNASYPGALVFSTTAGSWTFPDRLAIWHPASGTALDPAGRPRVSELVIYCPNPSTPNELLEITKSSDTSQAPLATDTAGWQTLITNLLSDTAAKRVVLTDLVRIGAVSELPVTDPERRRGCVRFSLRLLPSAAEWQSYQAGTTTWDNLSWAQSIKGSATGLRQAWLSFEIQLSAGRTAASNSAEALNGAPFFGSAAVHYVLSK